MRRTTQISKVYKAVLNKELEITESGEIWRIAKRGWDRWLKKTVLRECKRVRAEHDTGTYLMIRVMYNKIRLTMGAHRLVYYHFKGKIPKNKTVNHDNGNKKDNHPDNLGLMTDKQQIKHSRNVLKRGKLNQNGVNNSMSKLTEKQVVEIINRRKSGEPLKIIADHYNIKFQQVSRIAKGERWRHIFDKLNN